MTLLQLSKMRSEALRTIRRLSEASPLGRATRANVALHMGISYATALELLEWMRDKGDITMGETLNDFWVKLCK